MRGAMQALPRGACVSLAGRWPGQYTSEIGSAGVLLLRESGYSQGVHQFINTRRCSASWRAAGCPT